MRLFKKTTYTFYRSDNPDIVKEKLRINIASWDDLRNFKHNKIDKKFEGAVSDKIFIIRRISYFGNRAFNTQYFGRIESQSNGSKISFDVELNAGVKVIILIALLFYLIALIASIVLLMKTGKLSFVLIISSILIAVLILIIKYLNFSPTPRIVKEIEKLFD